MVVSVNKAMPIAVLGVGIGVVAYLLFDKHKKDVWSFASHHHKNKHHHNYRGESEREEYGHHKGGGHHHYKHHGYGGGYKGTRGWYTRKGHHHCTKGEPGCICTDPSKCHVIGGPHGRYDRQHGFMGYEEPTMIDYSHERMSYN